MIDMLVLFFGADYQQQIVSGALMGAIVRSLEYKGTPLEKLTQLVIGFLTGVAVSPACVLLIKRATETETETTSAAIVLCVGFSVGYFGIVGVVKVLNRVNWRGLVVTLLNAMVQKKNDENAKSTPND